MALDHCTSSHVALYACQVVIFLRQTEKIQYTVLSCQPIARVTVTSCFVYKVIRDL